MSSFFEVLTGASLLAIVFVASANPWRVAGPDDAGSAFAGTAQCATCHRRIFERQVQSGHARTLRKPGEIPELLQSLPLQFADPSNGFDYHLEKVAHAHGAVDLVAAKNHQVKRLHLLWAFGSGRHGLTFLGRTETGEYGQSLVSWYREINTLDITPGLDRKVSNAYEALADWITRPKREGCFSCHTTRNPETFPEQITDSMAGVQCERCHGPGQKHIEAIGTGRVEQGVHIQNPGKLSARQQVDVCGVCHGQPPRENDPQALSEVLADQRTVRMQSKRLLLSRCYEESGGRLKCTTCHNPHDALPASLTAFDVKCQICHVGRESDQRACPVSKRECVPCHMPKETVIAHSDFADHWIRIVRK